MLKGEAAARRLAFILTCGLVKLSHLDLSPALRYLAADACQRADQRRPHAHKLAAFGVLPLLTFRPCGADKVGPKGRGFEHFHGTVHASVTSAEAAWRKASGCYWREGSSPGILFK